MECIIFFGLWDLMFEYLHYDSCCFGTFYHEFMSLIKLCLVNFLNLYLFFMSFNLGERLFHILVPWSNIIFSEIFN